MTDAMQEFMQEGLKKFPEALSAVKLFSDKVRAILDNCLRERSREGWKEFKPNVPKKVSLGSPPMNGWCYLYATIEGKVGNTDATLEVGLWWNASGSKEPFIVYSSFLEGPPDLKRFTWKPKNPKVRAAVLDGKTRIYSVPQAAPDITATLDYVIDEMLLAVADVKPSLGKGK